MAGLIEPNQVGVREDLSNLIANAEMKDTPLTSMVPKGTKPGNMRLDWQMDADLDIMVPKGTKPGNMRLDWQMDADLDINTDGVLDSTDVTTFQNAAENRALSSVYCQWFRNSGKTGKLAQDVSNVAGVSEKENARAIMKVMVQVKQSMEARFSGDDDTTAESGATPYTARGLGSWINNSAQAQLPVPSQYRTPASSIDSTASTAAATEAAINSVLESIYMKSRISDLQLVDTNLAAGTAYLAARQVNKDQKDVTLAKKIDIMVGDFGTIKFHVSNFLGWENNSRDALKGAGRMYILDMKDLELCFESTPGVQQFPDLGGGPRFAVDSVAALKMGNPLKHGAMKPTAA
jgi:hypothetical protein